jgi:hypothetical protein
MGDEEHSNNIKDQLTWLWKSNLKAPIQKCNFYYSKIEFLGYVILDSEISIDQIECQIILGWEHQR